MVKNIYTLAVFSLVLFNNASWADHGRDFLLTQTARLGDLGSVYGISRQDYTRQNDAKAFVLEPLISWTATDWLSLEINSDAEKVEGESFNYESTMAGIRLRLTPTRQALVLGVATRYGFGSNSENDDVFKFSGLATYQVGTWLLGANANYKKHENSHRELGYAVSIKRELRHHLSLGVEAAGAFEGEKSGEVIVGIFNEVTHHFQINAGVGTGFNNDVDLAIKTAIIWRLK